MVNNIVDILIAQHNQLRKDMSSLKKESESKSPDIDSIIRVIEEFQSHLREHINLENNIFYPQLLEKMRKNNMDLTSIQVFIDEMKAIGGKVGVFIAKYAQAEAIQKDFPGFRMELNDMISNLILRIDAEEEGVYLYWQI